MNKIETWDDFFTSLKDTLYFNNLVHFHEKIYKSERTIYPPQKLIFNAFLLTPLSHVKVVILGQDPYFNKGQAMGLAFSVPKGEKIPPSLKNIFKEMQDDVGAHGKEHGDLTYLAKQGVFLLNTILTVEGEKPLSHESNDYKAFTLDVIKTLNKRTQPIVFMLWGSKARIYKKYITGVNKLVLEANHPSPLSANRGGFFDCKHFSKANTFLVKNGVEPINW